MINLGTSGSEPLPSTSATPVTILQVPAVVPLEQGTLEELEESLNSDSESEEGELKEENISKCQCFLFPSEDTEGLLDAIYVILGMGREENKELSVHDQLYAGLQTK